MENIQEMTAEWFKYLYPKERIYEVPIDNKDIYQRCREFELAYTWRIMMRCVGIDRKRGIAKYKRDQPMYFGNEVL